MWITRAARLAAPLLVLLATATPAAADPPYGTDPVHDNSSAQGSSIVDIRIDGKPESGFDRVTFEFGDSLGGYGVAYVDEVTQVESGDAVALEGSAFVQVTLTGIPNSQTAPQDTRTAATTTSGQPAPGQSEEDASEGPASDSPPVPAAEASNSSTEDLPWLIGIVIVCAVLYSVFRAGGQREYKRERTRFHR